MKKNHKLKNKVHKLKLALGLSGATALIALSSQPARNKEQNRTQHAIEKLQQLPPENLIYTDIEYQEDTIKNLNKNKKIYAHYTPSRDIITINHFEDEINLPYEYKNHLIHEHGHQILYNNQILTQTANLEQHFKNECHNEIRSNLFQNLQTYYEETQQSTPQDFAKHMHKIANNTRDDWEKTYQEIYEQQCLNHVIFALQQSGIENVNADNQGYQSTLDTLYNIGGINFWELMEKDISCTNKSVIETDKLIQEGFITTIDEAIGCLALNKHYTPSYIINSLPDFNNNMSFSQYYQLLHHSLLINSAPHCTDKFSNEDFLFFHLVSNLKHSHQGTVIQKQISHKLAQTMDNTLLSPSPENENKFQQRIDKLYSDAGFNPENKYNLNFSEEELAEIDNLFNNRTVTERIKKYTKHLSKKFNKEQPKSNLTTKFSTANVPQKQYYKWSPSKRVSKPKTIKILDLEKSKLGPVRTKEYLTDTIQLGNQQVYIYDKTDWSSKIGELNLDLIFTNDLGKKIEMKNIPYVDVEIGKDGLLAVNQKHEAILISPEGKIHNISHHTPIQNATSAYWLDDIIFINSKKNPEDDNQLYATHFHKGEFFYKHIGTNLNADFDDNKDIEIYDNNDNTVCTYTSHSLKQEMQQGTKPIYEYLQHFNYLKSK